MSPRRPGDPDWLPSPPEIEHAPEIALLAVLHRALDVAVYALLASHPCLTDLELSYHLSQPEVRAADAILAQAHRLRDALDDYRAAIAALYASTAADRYPSAPDPGDPGSADDIPF